MHSTAKRRARHQPKPKKPHPAFPLTWHPSGRWCKKVKGRLWYFGREAESALSLWLEQKDEILAGRKPQPKTGTTELRDILNHFLTAKRQLVDSGELAIRTWADYHATGNRLVQAFGSRRAIAHISGEDFASYRTELAKRWGPQAIANEIQRVRTIFKYAYEAELIQVPVRFGVNFKKPSKKTLRLARAEKGQRLLEPVDLLKLVAAATQPMKSMILLALNAGLGNQDCALLPLAAVKLETGWVDFPRPKTGVARRFQLWPETIQSIQEWLKKRPLPKDPADRGLVFLTKYKTSWCKSGGDGQNHANPISWEMKRLLKELGLYRAGLGFYMLRHCFRTTADGCRDRRAIDLIMGHACDDTASAYIERIEDARLTTVSEHVHEWLFGSR